MLEALRDAARSLEEFCRDQHPDNVCCHTLRNVQAIIARIDGGRYNSAPMDKPHTVREAVPGTMDDLIRRYYDSARWNSPKRSPKTRTDEKRILERFREKHGHRRVADFDVEHVEKLLGRMAGTPAAANKLRKLLKSLMRYAVRLKMRADNPLDDTQPFETKGTGFHTWTEDEIAKYQETHAIGTKARLAFELMLWTGQRRSDIVRMGRSHIADGKIGVVQQKTKTPLRLSIPQQLLEAIVATPDTGKFTLLVTEYGHPFTANGFGNKMRDWCDAAGLPNCTSHGLRKALSRRLAGIGASNQSIKSVTGHKTDSEVARYTRDVDQERMAEAAIAALSAWDLSRTDDGRGVRNAEGA